MKRIIASFSTFFISNDGTCREVQLLSDKTLILRVNCVDSEMRYIKSSIADFERNYQVNLLDEPEFCKALQSFKSLI